MIKLKKLIEEMIDAPPAAHVQQATSNVLSGDFVKYIKHVENGILKGYDKTKKLWFPYKDPSGWHIGFGHKIQSQSELESFKNGASDEHITKLLMGDLEKANNRVHEYIKKKYGATIQLTPAQNEMLTDFSYNGVLDKFPKFIEAVLKNDKETERKEYKRHVNGKELTQRNAIFYNRYLK